MKRRVGWRAALAVAIEEARREAFRPGRHDCALFAARCVEAMTGEDVARAFRGRYTTQRGGLRILRAAGHDGLVSAILAVGLVEIAPAFAGVGDIAMVPSADRSFGEALGVVTGPSVTVVAPTGLGVVPLASALRAFRV